MKKLILVCLFTAAAFSLFAGGSSEDKSGDTSLADLKDRGVFVLGLDDSFPPMGFRGNDGEITGFDIDLAREVTRRMGVELKFQPIDWDAKFLDLNSGDIDVIWNGLTINDERMEKCTFSKPYLANKQIVIVAAGSGIDLKADLAGKLIGVQMGSSADDAVTSDAATAASLKEMVKYQDNVQALMDLAAGNLDAVVVDEIMGRYYISKKEGLYQVATDYFAEEVYGIGFRKGEVALAAEVDRILDEMAKDGVAEEIGNKWFGENLLLR